MACCAFIAGIFGIAFAGCAKLCGMKPANAHDWRLEKFSKDG